MKIETLIKMLIGARRTGKTEVSFSSDEEGNEIHTDVFFGTESKESTEITLYPYRRIGHGNQSQH